MIKTRLSLTLSLILLVGMSLPVFSQETATPAAQEQALPADQATQTQSEQTQPVQQSDQSTSPQSSDTTSTQPSKATFSLNAGKEALKLSDDIKTEEAQVKAHPDDPEAHFLLAAAYSRSPYLDQAFREIKTVKAILKEKQDFEFIDRTLHDYEGLLQNAPNDSVILYRLALAYYLKGYTIEKYPHHYKTPPKEAPAEFYEKARNTMRQVIALNPKDTWARNYLGYLVSENGRDLSKAIGIWKESLAIDDKTNPGAYLMLSQAYLQKGDLKNAIDYGAKGLAIKQAMGMTLP